MNMSQESLKRIFLSPPPPGTTDLFNNFSNLIEKTQTFFLLSAAVELKIFDLLYEPHSLDEIVFRTGFDKSILFQCLFSLCSMGFVKIEDSRYQCTEISNIFLKSDSPLHQTEFVGKCTRSIKDLWLNLSQLIQSGPHKYEEEKFMRYLSLPGMAENALTGRLQSVFHELSQLPGISHYTSGIDLGGGHGLYAIAFTLLSPDLKMKVMDLPYIIPYTEEVIRRYGVTRVELIPGNFFDDSISGPHDIVFSSSNPSGKSVSMVKKISESLKPGGFFINIQSPGITQTDSLAKLEWTLWTLGDSEKGGGSYVKELPFPTEEYKKALYENGLNIIKEVEIPDVYPKGNTLRMIISQMRP